MLSIVRETTVQLMFAIAPTELARWIADSALCEVHLYASPLSLLSGTIDWMLANHGQSCAAPSKLGGDAMLVGTARSSAKYASYFSAVD